MDDHLDNRIAAESEGAPKPRMGPNGPSDPGAPTSAPRVVTRDGVAYVEGCDVAIWRLEWNRRSGAKPASLLKMTPGLTAEGLELACAYAAQHGDEMDRAIHELEVDDVSPEDEEDDAGEFQADLDELFERDAELFRRLAQ